MSDTVVLPPGPPDQLYNERTIIDGLFLGAIAYGIHLTLFISCFQILVQKRSKTRYDWFLLAYISLLFVMGNIGNGTNIKVGEMTFVDHRNVEGGPGAFFATGGGPVGLTCNVIYIINTWFQDGLLLYRFWMFFNRYGWYVLVLPMLLYLASIALSLVLIVMLCVPGITLWSTISINLAIPYWSISIALTVIITGCIASRLLFMRYQMRAVMAGSGSEYVSVTSMLVESAAIYSINGIIFVVSYGLESPIQNLALPVLGQTQSIAPLLIILRVLQGRAWSSATVSNYNTQTNTEMLFNNMSNTVLRSGDTGPTLTTKSKITNGSNTSLKEKSSV